MAATLANAGINPASGQRAVRADLIGEILSVMTTCGMYDFSGGWAYHVGLPAKSGVGGGIIAVLPGQLGIGVYSPALDERGNSLRGVKVCETVSSELGLHFLDPPRNTLSTVRARYTLAGVRSKRRRPPAEEALLARHGDSVAVYELQGDLRFATIEPVLREVVGSGQALTHVVLDLKRVASADAAATRMLARLADVCAERGQQLVHRLQAALRRCGQGLLDAVVARDHPRVDRVHALPARGRRQTIGGGACAPARARRSP
jgi:glutaminase